MFLCLIINAQEHSPIQVYTPNEYGAETQNWSISQSKNRNIYVANNNGLLEFNGAEWQLYKSPNETIIRCVKVIGDLIYTGCYREFGYWKRNEFGLLDYTSLSKKLNINFLEDEEFWNIISIEDYILFQSLNRIYIYNQKDQSYNIIESKSGISKMFQIDKTIYFQKNKDGIYKIEKGAPKLISNDKIFIENVIVNIFNNRKGLLIETEDNGFYILESNTPNKWNVPANKILSNENVYRSTQLKDNSFILGTRSNGIIRVTKEGNIDYRMNTLDGLSNNTIHYIFEDIENNIWLALNNGINCINVNSPFSIYNDKEGVFGTISASAIFNNNIYLGSNQGLFYKPLGTEKEFTFISGTQGAVWSLTEINNTLFCGHDSGTFIVNNGNVDKISDIQGTWNILPFKNNSHLLLQGNYDGLYILKKTNGKWGIRNKIDGFNLSSRFFEIGDKNEIMVSHEYRGIFKVKVNDDFTKTIKITKDTTLENELNTSIVKYNNDILFACKKGVFKYNQTKKIFSRDSILSGLIEEEDYAPERLLFDKKSNMLFAFSKKKLNYLTSGKLTDAPIIKRISLSESLPRGQKGYENITLLSDKKYLIGTSSGYVILDLDKVKEEQFYIHISSIIKNDLKFKANKTNVNKEVKGVFKNKENNIEFKYNVAEFEKYFDTEYQYQLIGIYPDWSNWSSSPSISFNNLPYGDYTLNVRAKVGDSITENIASYGFIIEKPWFLTKTMIISYCLLIFLLAFIIHNLYKRYFKKQREKLLDKTQKELELKELENKQQLMRFNNDKLRQDIENKNRELGISTMSLIKKNELLNNLKTELKKNIDIKSIKQIVKIIDKNINNTDDWNLFEEAFNHADKDFLKKIKELHPSLTSNDLRMCTYLRLNLSSKEIAPLLNISPRSVEVKRYRLRKKMGLSHESSLTDYILEI